MGADENSLTLAPEGSARDLKVRCPLVFRGIGLSAGPTGSCRLSLWKTLGWPLAERVVSFLRREDNKVHLRTHLGHGRES